MRNSNEIYLGITHKIIADLEKGELTWRKPWNPENLSAGIRLPLRCNHVPYSGINIVMLWSTAAQKGYSSPYWMTYKQANDMKAHVRKGEKGTQIVYADRFDVDEVKEDGTTETRNIPFLKLYTVFNASQLEGLPDAYAQLPEPPKINPEIRSPEIDEFFNRTQAKIFPGRNAAYFQSFDYIEMPPFESFNSAAAYYSTLAHEMAHWTKHPSRLNRNFNSGVWGDEAYAKEELVAELAASFLGADLGFEPVTKDEHTAYIQSWLKILKGDSRFIVQAASQAQKAVEYLGSFQKKMG